MICGSSRIREIGDGGCLSGGRDFDVPTREQQVFGFVQIGFPSGLRGERGVGYK